MKFYPCQQGTAEWLAMRAGRPTASKFSEALEVMQKASPKKNDLGQPERIAGDPTMASDRYACDLALERISGLPYGEPIKFWTLERGHELEGAARALYERQTGNVVEESGLTFTDDGVFGYSTDGLVQPRHVMVDGVEVLIGCEGLVEIKCPVDSWKIKEMWQSVDVTEYIHQMQGGMWITGAKWCDFIMYVPELKNVGRELFVHRVHRNEFFIEDMAPRLVRFNQRVEHFRVQLGGQSAVEANSWPFPQAA